MPTSSQLEDATLSSDEVGPEFILYSSESLDGPSFSRLFGARINGGSVLAQIVLLAQPTNTPDEALQVAFTPSVPEPDVIAVDLTETAAPPRQFTPVGFGDDAVAEIRTGTVIGGGQGTSLLVIWNDRNVQARVLSINFLPQPDSGSLTFDGLRLAQRQRDKIRAVLPE